MLLKTYHMHASMLKDVTNQHDMHVSHMTHQTSTAAAAGGAQSRSRPSSCRGMAAAHRNLSAVARLQAPHESMQAPVPWCCISGAAGLPASTLGSRLYIGPPVLAILRLLNPVLSTSYAERSLQVTLSTSDVHAMCHNSSYPDQPEFTLLPASTCKPQADALYCH